jgi:hypothetical protein
MFKKIVVGGAVFVTGYLIGTIFGFRAAVVDYVENDAGKLESMADDIYSSPEEGQASEQNIPEGIEQAIEEANAKGFQ